MASDPAILDALAGSSLFSGLGEADLASLASVGIPRKLSRGETVFMEGDKSRGFFLVLTGQVKLAKLSPAGKEQILHVHGPREPFAEAAIGEGATYPASAIATEDSRVLQFPRAAFQNLLGKRPAIAANLIARLSQRLRQMALLVENLSLREAPSRLARYLIELAAEDLSPGITVTIPMKKGELASLLGTRSETLSRIFRRLFEGDVIQVQGSEVKILDPDRLEMVAEGEFPGI